MTSVSKPELRQIAIARRAELAASLAPKAMETITRQLIACVPAGQKDKIVAGYKAIHSEVDIGAALGALQHDGAVIALPALPEGQSQLSFRRWSPGDPLFAGPFGTVEPGPDAPQVAPQIIFVPLLAFDERGYRVGYGKGYYDITLAALRDSDHRFRAIGVAYAGQQIDHVPDEAHDVPLDAIVTEAGIVEPGAGE